MSRGDTGCNPMTTTSRRLFIGLMADERLQTELAHYQAAWAWPPMAKLTPVANFHLTLHFLGNVDADAEARLRRELATVRMQPLQLLLSTPGHFPKGIAFIQPQAHAELDGLRAEIGRAVTAAELKVETQWHPHVTLARKAVGALPPTGIPSITWRVERFVLAWSHSGCYSALNTWPQPERPVSSVSSRLPGHG